MAGGAARAGISVNKAVLQSVSVPASGRGAGRLLSSFSSRLPWWKMKQEVLRANSSNKRPCFLLGGFQVSSLLLVGLGGEGEEEVGLPIDGIGGSGLRAAICWSSSVEDARRRRLSCLCSQWPKGGPPRPRSCGCSTSWPQAILEALQLRPKVHRRCYPKWFVPGDGITAPVVEFVVKLRWRRASRARLLFIFSLWGPFCKSAGAMCIFLFHLGFPASCNPTAGI